MCRQVYAVFIIFGAISSTLADPDCSRPPPFVNPHQCCEEPKPNDVAIKCAQTVGFPLGNEGGSAQRWQPPNVQTAACFADCILNQSNYMQNGELNMAAVTADVQQRFSNDGDASVLLSAFEKCSPVAKQKMAAIQNMPLASTVLRPCTPFGGLLLGCVYMEYFANCPENKWKSSNECDTLREHIRTCSNRDRFYQ